MYTCVYVRMCKYCTTHSEVGQNDSREEVLPVGEEEVISTHSQHNSDQWHVLLGGTAGVDCVRVRETEEWVGGEQLMKEERGGRTQTFDLSPMAQCIFTCYSQL